MRLDGKDQVHRGDPERVYAHLGAIRHRSGGVEYRVARHLGQLRDRLQALGFGTTNDTTGTPEAENATPRERETLNGDVTSDEWARPDSNRRPLAPEEPDGGAGRR